MTNPFDPRTPALALRTKLREVAWEMEDGLCSQVPDTSKIGQEHECELIPYGAAKLRMTEMPMIKTESAY